MGWGEVSSYLSGSTRGVHQNYRVVGINLGGIESTGKELVVGAMNRVAALESNDIRIVG